MSASTSTPPLVLDSALAEQLGVSRETLAEIRAEKLAPEIDWQKKGNAIAYTPAGLEKIGLALALQSPPASEDAAGSADVRTVFVKRLARRNTRLLFVTDKKARTGVDAGEEWPVRVREASMFVPGQEIRVRQSGDGWHLHGRQPLRRGRR